MSNAINSREPTFGSSVTRTSPGFGPPALTILSSGMLALAVLYLFAGNRLLCVDWRNPLKFIEIFLGAPTVRTFIDVFPGFLLIFGVLLILGLWTRDRHLGKCVLVGLFMTHLASFVVYRVFFKSLGGTGWLLEMLSADRLILGLGLGAAWLLLIILWLWEPAPNVFRGLAGGVIVGGIPAVLLGGPTLLALVFNTQFGEAMQKFRPNLVDMGYALTDSLAWFCLLGVFLVLLPIVMGIIGGLRTKAPDVDVEDPVFGQEISEISVIFLVVLMVINVFYSWVLLHSLNQLILGINSMAQHSLISPPLPPGVTLFLGLLPMVLMQIFLAAVLLVRSQIKEGLTLGWSLLAGGVLVVQGAGMLLLKSPVQVPGVVMIILGIVLFLQVRIRAAQGARVEWIGHFSHGEILGGVVNMAMTALFLLFPSWLLQVEFHYELGVTYIPLISWMSEEKGGRTLAEILHRSGIGSCWPMHLMFIASLFLKILVIGLIIWVFLRVFGLFTAQPRAQ